VLEERR